MLCKEAKLTQEMSLSYFVTVVSLKKLYLWVLLSGLSVIVYAHSSYIPTLCAIILQVLHIEPLYVFRLGSKDKRFEIVQLSFLDICSSVTKLSYEKKLVQVICFPLHCTIKDA